ncbi:TlpA family protein disulfide reductase [Nocardioides litoris]|uniref:TlpA family protein disulfide reductase n=1 Tax=Nocardioides litoris TaxID=1926648 RepID=UPI0014774FA3|nr:TlpA disulfide reductase family protein [Nocardioides litoris]
MSRWRAALAAVLLVLALAGCSDAVPAPGQSDVDVDTPELQAQKAAAGIEDCEPGDATNELPALVLPCLGGGPDVDLSTLSGPVLLNVWWSGCAPCRDEMPALQAFHEQHGDEVQVIGIDVETYPGSAIGFAETVGATYPQLADPGGTVFDGDLGLRSAFPQTLVVDADGRVVFKEAREFDSAQEIAQVVGQALGTRL